MVNETRFSVTLGESLAERLTALARDTGHSVHDCLQEAIAEYVATREDFAQALSLLDGPQEERVFLRVVGE